MSDIQEPRAKGEESVCRRTASQPVYRLAFKTSLSALGRTVESPRPGQLVASHRTALIEERTRFNIVGSLSARPLKSQINVLAGHVPRPDRQDFPRAHYLHEFLDSTVQAQRIAADITTDAEIAKQREHFTPQHVASEGASLAVDSVGYVLKEWLPAEDERLLAILAPAGYGKTVLTCELAYQLATQYLTARETRSEPIPLLVPFGQFRRLASFEGMILQSLSRKGVTDYTPGSVRLPSTERPCSVDS